jgi:hypothetical protein
MRINILSYEPAGGWILYDYAEKLAAGMRSCAVDAHINFIQKPGYDVTFHINYYGLRQIEVSGLHCTMVTHIDTPEKFGLVYAQAQKDVWGFCMSEETNRKLSSMTGISKFASFPPPAMIDAPETFMSVLIAARTYADGRKNEQWIMDFMYRFTPDMLRINIIGAGWERYVVELRTAGYAVNYHGNFDKTVYRELLTASDYLLVSGFDEGALSTIDAILYDVIPIVTAQGYHLEQSTSVKMHLYATHGQLMEIAESLATSVTRQKEIKMAMTDWNNFALRHCQKWQQIILTTGVQQ